MDEELFPANYSISKVDKEDGNYDSGSECEDDEEEEQAIPAFTAEEEDLDVYEVDDEKGTLVTDETKGMFTPILDAIAKRTPKMLHDLAWLALAFVCSIRPDIVEDAKVRIVINGPVFGPIASCATARITGSGGAERGWSDNKEVKTGKRPHLSSDKLRKQGTLYTSANIHRARIKRDNLEKPNCDTPDALWGDDDEQFDLGLEKWSVNVEELRNHWVHVGSSSVGWRTGRVLWIKGML
ncbi:hypothetical protein ACHAW5_001086 [Stephanodiscus triporus]|uniref:Uncharacterized protein n=1 Tax=Stephanodiscus triporus TaxID=2934178 RepID=A0ABD3PW65_9STRA